MKKLLIILAIVLPSLVFGQISYVKMYNGMRIVPNFRHHSDHYHYTNHDHHNKYTGRW